MEVEGAHLEAGLLRRLPKEGEGEGHVPVGVRVPGDGGAVPGLRPIKVEVSARRHLEAREGRRAARCARSALTEVAISGTDNIA